MRTIITLNDKRISQKYAASLFGKDKLDEMLRELKAKYIEDPSMYGIHEGMYIVNRRDCVEINFE
jgi:hypothetical protein